MVELMTSIRTAPVTARNLPEILRWWPARGQGEMDIALLPPDGVVAYDQGDWPLAAAWLCLIEGTPVAVVDWMIAKPGLHAIEARSACRAVFVELERIAREKGRRMLFATACRHSMAREIEACGFVVCADGMVHLAKPLP
jgi:hypothetical protein